MSKKIILNDNEVVFNEDVSSAQDWRSRDLNRALEAMFNATFLAGSATPGTITAGAIVSGLIVNGSTTNLSVNITPGLGLFSFGGDTTQNNRYRLASSETTVNLPLPFPSPTLYRWDVIEVSAEEITETETRQVLTSIGPTRTLVPTVVPKIVSSNLKFRVRAGSADTLANARLPALQPDPAWLPIAGILVSPADLVASDNKLLDLRKMFSYCSPARSFVQNDIRDGFDKQVSMSSDGAMVSAAQNWVHMGNYRSPIGATPQQSTINRPQLNPNVDKPASLALAVNQWYYIYAYRPTLNCGYTAMVLTNVAPISNDTDDRGKPSGTFDLPVPWPTTDASAPAMYMGAIRLYDNGGTFYPLPFRKSGGYTAISYNAEAGYSGADTQGKIHNAGGSLIGPGITATETINPDGDGLEAVPPHSRLVRLTLQFENVSTSATSLSFNVRSDMSPAFIVYRVADIDPDHMVTAELDVPVSSNFSVSFICSGSTPTDVGAFRGWVEGFYEEMP
jgi:hypothetical protein